MKRRWISMTAAALVAALAMGLTACGSQSQKDASSALQSKVEQTASAGGAANSEVLIAAAASLENVFEKELIPQFEKENPGITVKGAYDSSGKLQTQIEEGLAADLFFSAAPKQMKALDEKGMMDSASITNLLENKLVLITPKESKYDLKEFKDVTKCESIAVGDPASVPAGQYAKEALTNLGVWDQIESKLSQGTNVTEVLNWVAEGSADCGFVYATDAASRADKVTVVTQAPEGSLASPVIYPVGITKASAEKDSAEKFLEFLKTDEAMKAFVSYGFADNRSK